MRIILALAVLAFVGTAHAQVPKSFQANICGTITSSSAPVCVNDGNGGNPQWGTINPTAHTFSLGAGGSSGQVQWNNAGSLNGITGATTNGTTLTLVAPILGTPASATLTNAVGLPVGTGISGLGTGVATALGLNIGSVGAPVLFNGAGGTPASLTLTNATGLSLSTGVTGNLSVANLNSGTAASGTTFWRGDGTWATPSGGGGGSPGGVNGQVQFNSAGGFGGFTVAGDGTLNTATGVLTVIQLNGKTVTLAAAFTTSGANALTLTTTGVTNITLPTTGTLATVSGVLGTPTSVTLTNGTGLPIAGITGFGTGIATALAVNVGSAGAPVLFNGAGGTPSSLTLTNATGLPLATGVTGNLAVARLNSGTNASSSTFWNGSGAWLRASDIPVNNYTSATVLSSTDIGAIASITTGGVTLNTGVLTVGNNTSIYNDSGSSQTITQGAGVTLYFAGTRTTGNRTLAGGGIVTIQCIGTNTFFISGVGLT